MHSPLFLAARFFFIFFALVSFGSGSYGFVKTQSVASLVAGGISGVLLYAGTIFYRSNWQAGVAIDLIVSLALLGRFAPALFRRKFNPAGYVVPLAVVGVVLAVLVFVTPGAHP